MYPYPGEDVDTYSDIFHEKCGKFSDTDYSYTYTKKNGYITICTEMQFNIIYGSLLSVFYSLALSLNSKHCMGGSPGEVSENPVTYEKRKKG